MSTAGDSSTSCIKPSSFQIKYFLKGRLSDQPSSVTPYFTFHVSGAKDVKTHSSSYFSASVAKRTLSSKPIVRSSS